ncbi:MAG: YpmA family protein [Dethiobacter sp.]|nr:YpmA family protein [Dethiobacter sp.]
MESRGKLELLATLKLAKNEELYLLVDFLNRNLKNHNLMFGLTKKGEQMTFSVYEV